MEVALARAKSMTNAWRFVSQKITKKDLDGDGNITLDRMWVSPVSVQCRDFVNMLMNLLWVA
jgi:hypothetical protein